MSFKKFFERTVVQEVSDTGISKLTTKVEDLLRQQLPFNDIFGDALRFVIPFNVESEYGKKIRKSILDDYELDFAKWVGYKIKDADKKNPIRIGKLLAKRKDELLKNIKSIQGTPNYEPESEKIWRTAIEKIDELLKVTNLQQAYNNSSTDNQFSIVISRVPIDIARMSDFEWKSCHSEGRDYFYCALADAMLNAAIAYVVYTKDLEGLNLADKEIFSDRDRYVSGITALARIRIRRVIDSEGNELAVPSTSVYSSKSFVLANDFENNMINWARKQDISSFDFSKKLTLVGGSYEDAGYGIDQMINSIWGKVITYKHDTASEQEMEDNREEQFWDSVRDDINRNEDSEIIRQVVDDSVFPVSVTLYHDQMSAAYRFEFPTMLYERIEKIAQKRNIELAGLIQLANRVSGERMAKINTFEKWTYRITNDSKKISLTKQTQDVPDIHEYGEYYGEDHNRFEFKDYYEAYREKIIEHFEEFADFDSPISDEDDRSYIMAAAYTEKIIEDFSGIKVGDKKTIVPLAEVIDTLNSLNDYKEITKIKFPIPLKMGASFQKIGPYNEAVFLTPQNDGDVDRIYNMIEHINKVLVDITEQYAIPKDIEPLSATLIFVANKLIMSDEGKKRILDDDYYDRYTNSPNKFMSYKILHKSFPNVKVGLTRAYNKDLTAFISIGFAEVRKNIEDYIYSGYIDNIYKLYDEIFNETDDDNRMTEALSELFNASTLDDIHRIQTALSKHQQLELDLSSVNNYMGFFDDFIVKTLSEGLGDMGMGGLARRGGGGSAPQQQPGTTPPQPGAANQTAQTAPATVATPKQTSVAGKPMSHRVTQRDLLPNEIKEFDELEKLYGSNVNQYNQKLNEFLTKDPENSHKYINYLRTVRPQQQVNTQVQAGQEQVAGPQANVPGQPNPYIPTK